MPKLKYDKFKKARELGINIFGSLYRIEHNGNGEIIFAISGTDLSTLVNGHENIDFDDKSDKKLLDIAKSTSGYFTWIGHDFFPCEKSEIIK